MVFQGGGAKGVAYIGVLEALKELEEESGKKLNLKSIIGSSAGGILGLVFICLLHESKENLMKRAKEAMEKLSKTPEKDSYLNNEREGKWKDATE